MFVRVVYVWCLFQWNQECLAYLLQLITKFAVNPADVEAGPEDAYDIFESPKKKPKKSKSNQEKILIPRLNQVLQIFMCGITNKFIWIFNLKFISI